MLTHKWDITLPHRVSETIKKEGAQTSQEAEIREDQSKAGLLAMTVTFMNSQQLWLPIDQGS